MFALRRHTVKCECILNADGIRSIGQIAGLINEIIVIGQFGRRIAQESSLVKQLNSSCTILLGSIRGISRKIIHYRTLIIDTAITEIPVVPPPIFEKKSRAFLGA